jgi:hypothetical protein
LYIIVSNYQNLISTLTIFFGGRARKRSWREKCIFPTFKIRRILLIKILITSCAGFSSLAQH